MSETILSPEEMKYFESGGDETALEPQADNAGGGNQEPPVVTEAAEAPPEPEPQPAREQKHVPLAALQEERKHRQELQRELENISREHSDRMAKVQERMDLLFKAVQPPEQTAQPVPAFEQDPRAHLDARLGGLEQQTRQAHEALEALRQQQQQAQQLASIEANAVAQIQAFAKEKPDYAEAEQHLRNIRGNQIARVARLQGMTDAQIPAYVATALQNEARQVAAITLARGGNVAEAFYGFAQDVGYAPKAAKAAEAADNPLANVQRGQALATGIGSTGSAPAGKLSADQLANMSDQEFQRLHATTKGRAEIDALMRSMN